MAVKLNKEYVGEMGDVLEMREVMIRTGNDMCTLMRDMIINVHLVDAVLVSGAHVSVISNRFYDSLS